MKEKIAIIGAGQLGTALAFALKEAGFPIAGIASRTLSSAEFLAQKTGAHATPLPHTLLPKADIFFFTAPDDLIPSICEDLVAHATDELSTKTFFHCSGSLPASILSSAKEKNASIGSMHPLQTFTHLYEKTPQNLFTGTLFAIDGDLAAQQLATQIVHLLGGVPIELTADQKAIYHTAAVLVSNYAATLFETALSLFETIGIDRQKGLPALATLSEVALQNIKQTDPVCALTGPIARGDVLTVSRHMDALQKQAPQFLLTYRELGL